MTEYLNPEQLMRFLSGKKNAEGQRLADEHNNIKQRVWFFYIKAAKMVRGISKYNYDKNQVCDMLARQVLQTLKLST